ncbi:unnamed protein product [Cylindrotheca closterium]|uniref:Ribosome biogenesis regulatory protein n=1 Tax=Cylindrotheca closterium TaxID=2856 RepID=A0AAD2CHZ7_9STRA|nr:unnamed protein product [Cylindrotheca closterium]
MVLTSISKKKESSDEDSSVQEEKRSNESSSIEDSSSDEESENEEDVTAIFKGREQDESDDGGMSDADSDDNAQEANHIAASVNKNSDECIFDLRNMLAINSDQVALKSLYNKKSSDEKNISIPLDESHGLVIDEDFLLSKATHGCTQLVQALFQLPTERSDAGPLVQLPAYDEMKLPRALPPPPPKQETKWEKFAKAKGIPLNKEKRSRKVWDETTGTWMFRHGYEKANSKSKEWPIMEVGANDDPYADPWETLRDGKRARTDRNIESRMKNQERAGNLAKGTTNRVMKAREQSRKSGKNAGNLGRDSLPPSGLPVDLKGNNGDTKKRGKVSTNAALEAVQRSTASMGRFDQMREGEPERKKILSKVKKRKFESNTSKTYSSSEGEKSMKILNSVMNGGGVAKEKAIRKGKLAKGETAFDYEYDDGLGASSFKKKKGRAGAGKNKKMTKRRIK